MISPHELKNKAFTRTVRGYNPSEVDEHFAFLITEYTSLYKENDELTRRIAKLEEELKQYENDSEAIRSALMSAQKVSAKIVDDANAKAQKIAESVKQSCDAKLNEIRDDIKRECDMLNSLRGVRAKYEEAIKASLTEAAGALESLPDGRNLTVDADEAVRQILQGVKESVADEPSEPSEEETENTDGE